ncbi:MAG: diguanylate cyclase, partial [Cycloclasticus sp.]
EEFVALLPTASERKGIEVAERMRAAVASSLVKLLDEQELSITVSIGVSTCVVDEIGVLSPIDRTVLIGVADEALYRAKDAGRNRVMSGGEVSISSQRGVAAVSSA